MNPKKSKQQTLTLQVNSNNEFGILPAQRNQIIAMLESGKYPSLAQIARIAMVSPNTVRNMLRKDPDLRDRWQAALMFQADELAQTAIDICKDESVNAMAREKMLEFMMTKLHPERFGENAEQNNAMNNVSKRVIMQEVMPVIEVDENGIPLSEKPAVIVSPSAIRNIDGL